MTTPGPSQASARGGNQGRSTGPSEALGPGADARTTAAATGGDTMGVPTRGFHGRQADTAHKLPPGQYETRAFPVLSAGPLRGYRLIVGNSGSQPSRVRLIRGRGPS